MQTKNINAERQPTSNHGTDEWAEKSLLMIQQHNSRQNLIISSHESTASRLEYDAPPLPPRSAVVFTSMATTKQVEVEGYGPYKPVPPPKPLPHQSAPQPQQSDCFTPPPYRMPPYPLYSEPNIPGATGLDHPIAASSPATPQGLHTHSSKFPIEREVILSSTDKNSKIPILHDYKKKTKASVAPDVPPKQMAAWTQGQVQNHQILQDQTHPGLIQTIQQSSDPSGPTYRATYHPIQEYYNTPNPNPTGAVPRSSWHPTIDPNKPAPRPMPPTDEFHNPQTVSVQIECKDQKEQKNPKSMTKTYHTIKDIISNRFKSTRENEEKIEETGLNNNTEETRKMPVNSVDEQDTKKATCDQAGYGKQPMQQYQYNQHYIQQHMLAQQAQQQYQQQLKSHLQYTQQLAQARSQELITSRPDEQMYFQSSYTNSPQQRTAGRFVQQAPSREQNFVAMQTHVQFSNGPEAHIEDRRPLTGSERRSAQQLERDNLRQRSFEARRAASHPQLAYDDEVNPEAPNNKAPLQMGAPVRRGSHGNIMEAQPHQEIEKDSDDGGFLKRKGSRERRLDPPPPQKENHMQSECCESKKEVKANLKEDSKMDGLQGTPRRKLEGEIGKIEGVYNVGQRSAKVEDETKIPKKNNTSSTTSSDYDKTGGQSSSNVDSGRGSAAYSSGRRPGGIDLNGETFDTEQVNSGNNYRDPHGAADDNEWVDIVESELRHILEPKLHELSLQGKNIGVANSTFSDSISSMTPPLPPLSPGDQSSPNETPRNSTRYKHSSLPYGSKPDYDGYKGKSHTRDIPSSSRWNNSSSQKHRTTKKMDHSSSHRGKQVFGLENLDITSTTTRSMDLESILDGQSDSDEDISTVDARTIRKQLEGLEVMYSEVLKLLGVNKKYTGRYQPSDPRFSKRRYGSMSSLPSSSVSSRPMRDKRRATEERKKVRDIRGINKRFQRLESHVVTLARSVAHLSSEMRTQHLMIQEMENIRGEIAALRTQTNMLNIRSQSASRTASSKELPTLANPTRVKKLTKFFGDEPPLLRLFLRKLGYEKYATLFESERVGMVELPYMSEERLQKMGVPLGPRLRIMQEAQISVCKDNTLCIV